MTSLEEETTRHVVSILILGGNKVFMPGPYDRSW
jgi:hypothetical protein